MGKLTEDQEQKYRKAFQALHAEKQSLLYEKMGLRISRLRAIALTLILVCLYGSLIILALWSYPHRDLQASCRASQQTLKTQLEEYNLEYGFYPSESDWDAFLNNPYFWTPSNSAPKYCPSGDLYEYKSDTATGSVPVTDEHGTGFSRYELRCTNPEHNHSPD